MTCEFMVISDYDLVKFLVNADLLKHPAQFQVLKSSTKHRRTL